VQSWVKNALDTAIEQGIKEIVNRW